MNKFTKILSICLSTLFLSSCSFSFPEYDTSHESSIVEDDKPKSISLNKTSLTLEIGETFELTYTISPNTTINKDVTWASKNTSIATVNNGVITAVSAGTTTITVTPVANKNVSASCTIRVNEVPTIKPSSIQLSDESVYLNIGSTHTLTWTVLPDAADNKNVKWSSSNESIATVENGVITAIAKGNAKITATSIAKSTVYATCSVTVTSSDGKIKLDYTYKDVVKNNYYSISALPSIGEPNILVIPVWFNDSSTYISSSKKETLRNDIEKAYFGTKEETGWHSVSSYFYEESRGKLNIQGKVSSWYECSNNAAYYSNTSKTNTLVKTITDWYFTNNPSEKRSDYDFDKDGYLDGVMVIYAYPDFDVLNNDSYDNLWAYCYWIQNTSLKNVTNPGPNVFFWASYDFMYGTGNTISPSYHNGDTSHCTIDAHTYIHEMGHVLGLSDYYDYSKQTKPAGGFSMQDYNVGGHDPFSVMALGWVDPIVATSEGEYEIGSFQETGDLLLVDNSGFSNSPFDEYILVELYSPTGLNKFDSQYKYNSAYPQGPMEAKARIWHVDARLISYKTYHITSNPLDGKVETAMTNTCFAEGCEERMSPLGEEYYDYNFLQLIRRSSSANYKANDYLSSGNMFGAGSSFNLNTFSKQFVNGTKLNNGELFPFTIKINSISSGVAKISITK